MDTIQQLLQSNPDDLPARTKLLHKAADITAHDRNKAYGAPEDNFQNIADYWNLYLAQAYSSAQMILKLSNQDVAHMMILMKMARLATNPSHYDSLLDVAGYAACAADCQEQLSAKAIPAA